MKKCPHCNGIFSDDFEKCPQCDIVLSNYTSDDKEKDDNEIEKEKIRKLITIGALVAAFILGIGFKSIIGVKRTDYVNLKIKNEELQKQYDELSTAKDGLQKEYDTYKRKMQPYEEQQATAEQAAIEEQNKKAAENAKQVAEQKQQTEAHRDNMYGISDKDINSVNDTFSAANVRNDKTGNWRISKISENINMKEYALSYYKKYFKSDSEIHWIVNFTLKTTTCISVSGNMLFVDVHEYVDGEEHYADTLGSGMTLSKFHIYTDNGDIEKIQ